MKLGKPGKTSEPGVWDRDALIWPWNCGRKLPSSARTFSRASRRAACWAVISG